MGTYSQLLQKNNKTSVSQKTEKILFPESPANTLQKKGSIASKQASNIANNIAILQFDDEDFIRLQEAAYKAQTFRLSQAEVEWLKDTAYQLSKEMKRGKATQVTILRVSLRLFSKLLAHEEATVIKILEQVS